MQLLLRHQHKSMMRALHWGPRRGPSLPVLRAALAASSAARPDAAPAAAAAAAPASVSGVRSGKQTLDYTALCACTKELQDQWVPSKVEEVRYRGTAGLGCEAVALASCVVSN
jgi:hypothetical protein